MQALEERAAVLTAWRFVADEKVQGGARLAYVFGSLLLFLVTVQVASGILLAMDYAPTTDSAHESVARIMDPAQVPWGRVVRGLHHHGASLAVVVLVLHVAQVILSGAYRKPREVNWLTGLAAGAVLLGLAFTGDLLPWDQTAYYATRVGLNILRATPVIGSPMADVLAGGPVLGNLTLTRFTTIHVVVLPALLAALLLVHLALFRRHGVTASARHDEASLAARAQPFWPHQALLDVVVMLVVFLGLLAMVSFVEAPLGDKADPSRPFDARPEWYFFWLFELLHHFEPPIDWVGTLLIPGLVAAFFVLLPWLDRGRSRAPRDRRGPLLAAGAMGAALAVLTVNVAVRDALGAASEAAQPPESLVPAPGISAVQAGMIYGDRCTECHARDGSPVDPEARDFRSADFKRMARTDFAALVKVVEEGGDIMPAFAGELTPEEIRGVLTHVVLEFPEVDEDEVRRALAHAQAEFEKKEE